MLECKYSIKIGVLVFVFCHCVLFGETFLVSDGLQRVHTQYGDIIGHIATARLDNTAYQLVEFLGIPYAEPPIGDLRFRKPVPIKKIQTPYSAHTFGPACVQQPNFGYNHTSEDCLYLNVYVPSNAGDLGIIRKAVMVFIHGGGFTAGSGDISMDVLSTFTDTIGVSINYRLGALGFLSTHDEHGPGNYGLWDQHVAIQWVKENIASFGGDPRNITIFGESAGSSSVLYQTLYPGSKGVFSRAIAESGTLAAWGATPREENYNRSLKFASMLNCTSSSHEQLIDCLRGVSSQDMKNAIVVYEQSNKYIYEDIIASWVPVYDGDFVILEPRSILSELDNPDSDSKFSSYNDIDLLIGMNNYDGAVYAGFLQHAANLSFYDINGITALTNKEIEDDVIPEFLKLAGYPQTPLFRNTIINEYTNWQNTTDSEGRIEKIFDMITDMALRAPSIAMAAAHSDSRSQTYVYQFTYASKFKFMSFPYFMHGANHADELFYVFGLTEQLIKSAVNATGLKMTEDDVRLSKACMTMWSNFAKSGNPNFPVSLGADTSLQWPQYDRMYQQYLEIKLPLSQDCVGTRLGARGVAFWNQFLPSLKYLTNATQPTFQ